MEIIEGHESGSLVRLTKPELVILNNALNEVLNGPEAIDDWEFQTRIGATRSAADLLLRGIAAVLGQRGGVP